MSEMFQVAKSDTKNLGNYKSAVVHSAISLPLCVSFNEAYMEKSL